MEELEKIKNRAWSLLSDQDYYLKSQIEYLIELAYQLGTRDGLREGFEISKKALAKLEEGYNGKEGH